MKLKTLIPKSEVRNSVIKKRNELTETDILQKTKLIYERFFSSEDYIAAQKIHTFISTRKGEIDTKEIVDRMRADGKSIVVSKLNKASKNFHHANFIRWEHLKKNQEGYYEPTAGFDEDFGDVDLVIVPAIAVSLFGHRVGYGGGYYDRFLKSIHVQKIAFAFEYQVFDNIETEEHDERVDKIITERRIIVTRPSLEHRSETT